MSSGIRLGYEALISTKIASWKSILWVSGMDGAILV